MIPVDEVEDESDSSSDTSNSQNEEDFYEDVDKKKDANEKPVGSGKNPT